MAVLNPNGEDWRCLIAAARDCYDDDTPRLVFCDMLGDLGHDGDPFQMLIREGIAFARHPDTAPNALGPMGWEVNDYRYAAWQHAMHLALKRSWLQFPCCRVSDTLPEHHLNQWRWVRGFPDQVVCSFDYWAENYELLTALGPVGDVAICTMPYTYLTSYPVSRHVEIGVQEPVIGRIAQQQRRRINTKYLWSHKDMINLGVATEWQLRSREVSVNATGIQLQMRRVVDDVLRAAWPPGELVQNIYLDVGLDDIIAPPEPWPQPARVQPDES